MSRFRIRHPVLFVLTVLLLSFVVYATTSRLLAQSSAETEPNESFGAADSISLNSAVTGTINPAPDADWYTFSVERHGELRVQITGVAPELDINLRVWNGNKDVISNWYAPLAKGGNTDAVVDLPAPGRYYLEVRDGGDDAASSQPYSLGATYTPSDDLNEPNDDFNRAASLAFDQAVAATILPARDADWFVVTVERHGELRLHVSNVPADLDISLRVWNSNKDVISNWFTPLAKGGDTDALVDLPAPGRYYVEVRDGSDDARSILPFSISAAFTPSPDAMEANNDFGVPTNLVLGQPVQAAILPVRDVDWFIFDVSTHGELRVEISQVPAELDMSLRVWNGNKDVISNWFAPLAKGGNTSALVDLPSQGRYLLEVRDGNDDARSILPFTLRADFTPSPDTFEPNDDFGRATSIGVDRSVQATILPVRDADWFNFDAAHHGELQVQVSNVPAEMDVVYRLWNSHKDTLTNWFTPLAKGGNTDSVIDLAAPGRYYLEVRDSSDDARSILPYTLSTKFLVAADNGEPNNSQDAATSAGLDATIPGNILPAGDRDWYRIELTQAGDLHILVTNVSPDLAISFHLWDDKNNVLTNWFAPLSKGGNTEAVVPVTAAGVYLLEVADNSASARSIQPYLLRFSMSPIDLATMIPPAAPAAATAPVTETTAISSTTAAGATILTSGQVGPLGADIFVQEPRNLDVDGARLSVPPDSLDTLTTVHVSISDLAPEGAPMGLQPAGHYWYFDPTGLNFKQPVTITLPVPTGAAAPSMFVGHWDGSAWQDLGGEMKDGLITAQTSSFSAFGVFCGNLSSYRNFTVINDSTAPYIELHHVSGPSSDPDNPDPSLSGGCPIPSDKPQSRQIDQGKGDWLMLRPGVYHFVVAYPQPQPGTANSLFVTVKPGSAGVTIRITDTGATSDDPNIAINFPGRTQVAGTNQRPIIACNATVPAGVVLANLDPASAALPSRVVAATELKLEQLPPKGPGIGFIANATDPENSQLRTYWTTNQSTTAGDPVASGAAIASPLTFQPTLGGTYTVFLTVYDQLGLFDECRWVITVTPNNRPQIEVLSGRTIVEFGRLDEVRQSEGVGGVTPVLNALPPGVVPPVAVPSLTTPPTTMVWGGLSLCPNAVPGPFGDLPAPPESVLAVPAPVDTMETPVTTDVTNRWLFPGRTCVWAVVADADGDPLTVAWEWPGPIFGSGTFYAAVEVPAGFDPNLPGGIALGALIRTNEQLNAYNAWISQLYNLAGVVPSIVWEAWDDPCPPGSGGVENPCPSSISAGGIEAIVARVSDGFSLPPATDFAYIGVQPEAVGGGECGPVFFISSLTPNPSDPMPLQGVEVTARLSPVTEGCPVIMSIVGTDGYADRQVIPSNKSGEAALFIPGGADNVVDRVTAEVCVPLTPNATQPSPDQQCTTTTGLPGWLLFMDVSYSF